MASLPDLERRAREILEREQKAYEAANPKSRGAFQQSLRVVPGGVTRLLCFFPPFRATRPTVRDAASWT